MYQPLILLPTNLPLRPAVLHFLYLKQFHLPLPAPRKHQKTIHRRQHGIGAGYLVPLYQLLFIHAYLLPVQQHPFSQIPLKCSHIPHIFLNRSAALLLIFQIFPVLRQHFIRQFHIFALVHDKKNPPSSS